MTEKANEIFKQVFTSYESNEDTLKLKFPESSKIHEFNMALKELVENELIIILNKNMTVAEIFITEKGLENAMY